MPSSATEMSIDVDRDEKTSAATKTGAEETCFCVIRGSLEHAKDSITEVAFWVSSASTEERDKWFTENSHMFRRNDIHASKRHYQVCETATIFRSELTPKTICKAIYGCGEYLCRDMEDAEAHVVFYDVDVMIRDQLVPGWSVHPDTGHLDTAYIKSKVASAPKSTNDYLRWYVESLLKVTPHHLYGFFCFNPNVYKSPSVDRNAKTH